MLITEAISHGEIYMVNTAGVLFILENRPEFSKQIINHTLAVSSAYTEVAGGGIIPVAGHFPVCIKSR